MNGNMATIFNLPRVHTALAQWLFVLLYMLPQKKRFSRRWTVLLSAAFLPPLVAANLLGEHQQGGFWLLCMLICLLLMAAQLWAVCRIRLPSVIYLWSRAFLAAEFSASLEWQITYYVLHALDLRNFAKGVIISCVIMTLIFGAIFLLLFIAERWNKKGSLRFHATPQEALCSAVIALAVFAFSNIHFAFPTSAFTESMGTGILYVRTLFDLAGIILLFAYGLMRHTFNASRELDAMNALMHQQYEQYRIQRENNETLRRMYHDLKHQLSFINAEPYAARRSSTLAKMQEAIGRYEAATCSGHTVLDTLLTGKNLLCMEKKISMTCFADARHLDFMDAMELCAIFGNALDNAIEYEETLTDVSKRLIKVQVYAQPPFVIISISNYCPDDVFQGSITPKTTKADKQLHGYGLKSIRHAVEKYDGHMTLSHQDAWFTLRILIPAPTESSRM